MRTRTRGREDAHETCLNLEAVAASMVTLEDRRAWVVGRGFWALALLWHLKRRVSDEQATRGERGTLTLGQTLPSSIFPSVVEGWGTSRRGGLSQISENGWSCAGKAMWGQGNVVSARF